ncbi:MULTISPECIES: hypothetical protein [Kingella]|uniref:Uncharacterized protein n=1 Tax=Kingella bonacorsii TaxID=2796361 RepID=A0ABS1BQZ0_9NEIS|nr:MULTISPECIES: hypothetical protein [Kingella]MBK0395678.1 hypothetical protein [Kingella bonacorsii]
MAIRMRPRQPENIIQPACKYFSGCLFRATRQPETQSNQTNALMERRRLVAKKTLAAPPQLFSGCLK